MLEHDKHQFSEIYRGVCATYGREANKEAMRTAWNALRQFSLEQVSMAYSSHVMTSKYMPTPAEILDAISSSNPAMRRPGADEAWARMPRSEDDSVVWTDEMSYAWGIANGLVNTNLVEKPDWIAARMAFKDAYTRAVDTAKAQGRRVRWTIARGQKKDNLEDVITEALRFGYITSDEARPHLLELEHIRTPSKHLLLEGAKETGNETRVRELAKLKSLFKIESPNYDLDAIRAECEAKDRAREQQGRQDAA